MGKYCARPGHLLGSNPGLVSKYYVSLCLSCKLEDLLQKDIQADVLLGLLKWKESAGSLDVQHKISISLESWYWLFVLGSSYKVVDIHICLAEHQSTLSDGSWRDLVRVNDGQHMLISF